MTQQNFAIFRIFNTQYFIMWWNFILWSTYRCAHPNMTDSESAGYFNDSRKVEHGKYFLGTDSALSDIFENRKPQSLWWAEKNLIKTIGNLVQKYYNNGHIFIYFTFKLCVVVLLSQSVLKVPKFCISSLNKQSVLWSWRHQSVSCLRDSDGENQQSFVWKFSKQPSGARNSCGIGGRGNLILRENYS